MMDIDGIDGRAQSVPPLLSMHLWEEHTCTGRPGHGGMGLDLEEFNSELPLITIGRQWNN